MLHPFWGAAAKGSTEGQQVYVLRSLLRNSIHSQPRPRLPPPFIAPKPCARCRKCHARCINCKHCVLIAGCQFLNCFMDVQVAIQPESTTREKASSTANGQPLTACTSMPITTSFMHPHPEQHLLAPYPPECPRTAPTPLQNHLRSSRQSLQVWADCRKSANLPLLPQGTVI